MLLDEIEEGGVEVLDSRALADIVGAACGEYLTVADEQQFVAAGGLVHDVAGDEDRGAPGGAAGRRSPGQSG